MAKFTGAGWLPVALPLLVLLSQSPFSSSEETELNATGKGYVTLRRANLSEDVGASQPQPTELPSPSPLFSGSVPATLSSINGGKPFYLDRNPITGSVDFDLPNIDYEYDAEEHDGIDRKDNNAGGVGRPSYNVFGVQAVNHRYYHSDKVPLISGSYANTKVQGTAGHRTRQPPTSPTPTPSYYPVRPQHTSSVPTSTTTKTSAIPATVSSPSPSSTAVPYGNYGEEEVTDSVAAAAAPAYEYEYEYVDNYAEEGAQKETTVTERVRVTTMPSVTTTTKPTSKPTTMSTTIVTTTTTPKPSIKPAPEQTSTFSAIPVSTASQLVAKPSTTTILPTIIYKDQNIVTSMPLGTHFHFRPASSPPSLPKQPDPTLSTHPSPHPEVNTNVVLAPEVNPYGSLAEEPFRPLFGPGEGIEETIPPSRWQQRPPQRIPAETPTRINYQPKKETPSFFLVRPDVGPQITVNNPPPPPPPPPSPKPFIRTPNVSYSVATERPPPDLKPAGNAPSSWPLPTNPKDHVKFPTDNEPLRPPVEKPNTNVPSDETKLGAPVIGSGRPQRPPLPSLATQLVPPAEPGRQRPPPTWDPRPPRLPSPHPASPPLQPNARPKVDVAIPTYVQNGYSLNANRNKGPHHIERPYHDPNNRADPGYPVPGLPNILPQFRPNVKVPPGHPDNFRHGNRPPFGSQYRPALAERLHPPPPAHPPSHPPSHAPSPNTRLNRNDADGEMPLAHLPPPPPPPRPLVRRRTGPQVNEVTTLQMMQQQLKRYPQPPTATVVTSSVSDKQPVYVVYPVKGDAEGAMDQSMNGGDGGVVVGTRGPHLPVPPSNLNMGDSKDDGLVRLAFGQTKLQKPVLQAAKDRGDTPVLKYQGNKVTTERPVKSDFPYTLLRPDSSSEDSTGENKQNDKISDRNDKFTNSKNADDTSKDKSIEDTDINIIPYLQDYMPFATKKPTLKGNSNPAQSDKSVQDESLKTRNDVNRNKISTTLTQTTNNGQGFSVSKLHTPTHFESTTMKVKEPVPSTKLPSYQQGLVGSGNSEFTVSAIMHTQPQYLQSQDKTSFSEPSQQHSSSKVYSNHKIPGAPTSSVAPALNFQAPFLASVNVGAAPTNQGWSVVGTNVEQRMKPGTVDKAELDRSDTASVHTNSEMTDHEPSNFDFENFKPQLFGGFQPIYDIPEELKPQRQITTERQEKKLL